MWLFVVLAGVALGLVVFGAHRHASLFVIRVSNGQAHFVRGRIPPRLLADIKDVVRLNRAVEGTIRCVAEGGSATVRADGFPDGAMQQLRNVVGTYQLAQIRAGARP